MQDISTLSSLFMQEKIVSAMKTNQSLCARRDKHIPQGPFNTHPIFVEKAKGATITDVEGKEYIDFAGGIRKMI